LAAGARRSWPPCADRRAERDFHLREDILQWLGHGALARLDLAFSRDAEGAGLAESVVIGGAAAIHRGYVQDALRAESMRLRRWVDDGATILVCGSLQGMAPGVDAALREILGDAAVERMRVNGRYRRDVY